MTPATNPIVDLRSDTVTKPTPEMKKAMFEAAVGDDVLGDDPTVTLLEQKVAQLVGMESAVYVPSGTMGNQVSIASWAARGDAILAEEQAHILYYEVAGPAIIAGVVTKTVPSENGVMSPDAIEKRVMKASLHTPGTTLLAVENTHNRSGGTITPLAHLTEYRKIADRHGMKMHLDGARAFNAAVALNVPISTVTKEFDSVSICLSKGLRAPIGSVVCGPETFINRARVWRKRLGGGMRQAGILAAAGIFALDHYVDRLSEDHRRAHQFAMEVNFLPGFMVETELVQTNIVVVQTDTGAAEWCEKLKTHGILCLPFAENTIRFVFHADVSDEGLQQAIDVFKLLSHNSD